MRGIVVAAVLTVLSGCAEAVLPTPLGWPERRWAEAAWSWFDANTTDAGVVPVASGAPFTTMWAIGDQVAALVAARRYGFIDSREFDRRFSAVLGYLYRVPLAFDALPNRFYDVNTGAPLGGDIQLGTAGWSAVDTGRLLVWLRIAAELYPEYARYITNVAMRLSVCEVADAQGRLLEVAATPEGPVPGTGTARGYDAYAAQGFRAWGLDVPLPGATDPAAVIEVQGIPFAVPTDPAGAAPVMTAPPAYLGVEFAFDPIGADQPAVAAGRPARALWEAVEAAQARRFADTGVLTARTAYRRNAAPWEIYDTVLAAAYPWSTIAPSGEAYPALALVSTRAAFALFALGDGDDAAALMDAVRPLFDPEAGWYEGRYEASGGYETARTSATNAFVLESLLFRRSGPLFPASARPATLLPPVRIARDRCVLPLAAAWDAGTPDRRDPDAASAQGREPVVPLQ